MVYPDYDHMTFQVGKPGTNFYSEMDYWFYSQFQDHKLYQSWRAGIDFVERSVDKKYFNWELGRAVGFVGFLTPFYHLGKANYHNSNRRYEVELPDRF